MILIGHYYVPHQISEIIEIPSMIRGLLGSRWQHQGLQASKSKKEAKGKLTA